MILMYPYGLIGNCQVSGLVSEDGSLDWLCLPRPDSEPVFGRILDPEGGRFSVSKADPDANSDSAQRYLHNTNILQTRISFGDGAAFQITDFAPRFEQHGRIYRPAAIFRKVEPLSGSPVIRVSCRPVDGWSKSPARGVRGNSHLRFEFQQGDLRLATSMPMTYLAEETAFPLKENLYFALTWGLGIEDNLTKVSETFLENTANYWRSWVKHCSIPSLYQNETIRSALALKLHCYEDTGAILAALTSSLPEEPGGGRNWDYRYCWLRDAYFVLSAFHHLGHYEEMEGFLKYLLNIAHQHEGSPDRLRPVYTLSRGIPVPERVHDLWQGYRNSSPVRSNNQAAEHVQNDVYGEMVLTLAPIFFDERFYDLRTADHEDLLRNLSKYCARSISQPDAGLWEARNGWQEHSFANLMCWAGLERVQKIQELGYLRNLSMDVAGEKQRAEKALLHAVVNGALRNGPRDGTFDAALAQLPILRFPDRDLNKKTVGQIIQALSLDSASSSGNADSFFYRYLRADDFGKPRSAFVICSFWIVQALVRLGERDHAERIMKGVMTGANRLGLFSEHFLPAGKMQFGNFPQAYSHVGQINAAFAVSPPWDAIW